MKNTFSEYYNPDFEKLWKECVFVFDTSSLLNLYRGSKDARDSFLSILNKVKTRSWIPYHVGWEYQKNRIEAIINREAIHESFKNELISCCDQIRNKINDNKRKYPHEIDHLYPIVDKFKLTLMKSIETNIHKHINEQKITIEEDYIRDKLDKIFSNRVGKEYPPEKLSKIFITGKERFENKIPPGYEDIKKPKDKEKYGDLIIWFQIIEKAKECGKPVIFITDDLKEDWVLKINGEIKGARVELIKEFKNETNFDFYLYSPEKFMEYSNKYLETNISSEVIKEMQDIRSSRQNIFDGFFFNYVEENHLLDPDNSLYKQLKIDKYFQDKINYVLNKQSNDIKHAESKLINKNLQDNTKRRIIHHIKSNLIVVRDIILESSSSYQQQQSLLWEFLTSALPNTFIIAEQEINLIKRNMSDCYRIVDRIRGLLEDIYVDTSVDNIDD